MKSWGFTPGEKRAILLICAAVLVTSGYRIYQHAVTPEHVEIGAEDSIAVDAIRTAYLGSSSSGSGDVDLDTGDTHGDSDSEGLLNLNTATRAQLEELPGIGPVLAARILEARGKTGRFIKVDDLLVVPGIGAKRLETIRPLVICDGPEESDN